MASRGGRGRSKALQHVQVDSQGAGARDDQDEPTVEASLLDVADVFIDIARSGISKHVSDIWVTSRAKE
eukprot:4827391-Heterocapsa_arctica.AAC.1